MLATVKSLNIRTARGLEVKKALFGISSIKTAPGPLSIRHDITITLFLASHTNGWNPSRKTWRALTHVVSPNVLASFPTSDFPAFPSMNRRLVQIIIPFLHRLSMTFIRLSSFRKPSLCERTREMTI
jgi:hypothetical protein